MYTVSLINLVLAAQFAMRGARGSSTTADQDGVTVSKILTDDDDHSMIKNEIFSDDTFENGRDLDGSYGDEDDFSLKNGLTQFDMIDAIQNGDTSKMVQFIDASLYRNCPCLEAISLEVLDPLQFAVFHDSYIWAETLLKTGYFDINELDRNHSSLLHRAIEKKNLRTVQVLLEEEARTDLRTANGMTALEMCMLDESAEGSDLFNIHRNYGAFVDSSTLFTAAKITFIGPLRELLLSRDIRSLNINEPNSHGHTLLHILIRESRPMDLINLVLRIPQTDINKPEESTGRTPLHLAALKNNTELINALIEKGANVFVFDYFQKLPFNLTNDEGLRTVFFKAGRRQDLMTKYGMIKTGGKFQVLPRDLIDIIIVYLKDASFEAEQQDLLADHTAIVRSLKISNYKKEIMNDPEIPIQLISWITDAFNNMNVRADRNHWNSGITEMRLVTSTLLKKEGIFDQALHDILTELVSLTEPN